MNRVIVFFALLLFSTATFGQSKEVYLKLLVQNPNKISEISKIVSIDKTDGRTVYAYANEKELVKLEASGYEYELLQHPSTLQQVEMSNLQKSIKEWDTYPTYDGYVAIMQEFAATYPNICHLYEAGTSIEGRKILYVKISDNASQNEAEPEFLYTSSIHGDETTGFILILRMIDHLLSNYGTDDRVNTLVNNVEIWMNPLSNPDGTYAGGNNSVNGATRANSNGVDLNRNFADPEDGNHPDGNEWQTETMVMMQFAEDHHISLSANYHGGAEVMNYPWDTWPQLHTDTEWLEYISHLYADAAQAVSPSGYFDDFGTGVTNGYAWYTVAGGRQDYMTYFHNCREICIEVSDTKLLPTSQLNNFWNYNFESMMLYMEQALYGVQGRVLSEVGNNPLNATITIAGHDMDNSFVVTDPANGDYTRFLAPGSYDITYSAYGYETETVENVQVAQDTKTPLDVYLGELPWVAISGQIIDAETGNAISGATVQILNTPLEQVISNENGIYNFPVVYYGTYDMKVTKEGYSASVVEVEISNTATVFNVVLQVSNAESFESGNFNAEWEMSGDMPWTIDNSVAYDGDKSAKSGDISDSENSITQITVENTMQGEISFFYKVSSEAGYDYLEFYIDNLKKEQWAGEIDWTEASYNVTEGTHTYKWVYLKDNSTSSGSDCAWVDFINFPPQDISNLPILNVSVNQINATVNENQTATANFSVANIGGGTLDYTLTINNNPSWITLNQTSGSLNSGENDQITVSFNAEGLASGNYTTTINAINGTGNTTSINVAFNVYVTSVQDFTISNLSVFPNPATDIVVFTFKNKSEKDIAINIYDVQGIQINTLTDHRRSNGNTSIEWNCSNVSNGLYFYSIEIEKCKVSTGKIIIAR